MRVDERANIGRRWLKKTRAEVGGGRGAGAGESPFICRRYREWLPRFFTKLIECSPPLRTMRQLPAKLSSAGCRDAPVAIADNIKSARRFGKTVGP